MKLFDTIRRARGGREKNRAPLPGGRDAAGNVTPSESDKILCRDREGRGQKAADLAAFLSEEYRRRREERLPFERQWTLNANFFAGSQNCDINRESGELQETLPAREYEEGGCYNRIAPLLETRLSALRSLSFAMTVRPRSSEAEDCEKSSVATRLLRYTQSESDFASRKDGMLLQSELYGTAFLHSYWDKEREEPGYTVLSPYEVFPASVYRSEMEEQESILLAQVVSVDAIEERFGVRVKGGDVDVYALSPVGGEGFGLTQTTLSVSPARARDSATLLTYYERPSARFPAGRMMMAAAGVLLFYGDLPYDDIPLVALKCKEAPGQFFGRSAIVDLIPLQRAYNGVKNKIHDYIRAVAANPLLLPEGAVPDAAEFAARGLPPGEIIEYNAARGKPEPLPPAPLPAELRYECETLSHDMEYTAGVSQLMAVGKIPAGVTSGTAIENLRAIDNSRLALSGENLRRAVRRLAVVWLSLWRRYVSGERCLLIVGENEAGSVLSFSASDLNSFDVVYEAENELVVSDEMQKQNFLTALNLGLLADEDGKLPRAVKSRARHMLKLGGDGDILGCDELEMQAAERENAAFLCGEDPTLSLFDDDELHIVCHRRLMLEARFGALRKKYPARAAAMERHLLSHMLRRQTGGQIVLPTLPQAVATAAPSAPAAEMPAAPSPGTLAALIAARAAAAAEPESAPAAAPAEKNSDEKTPAEKAPDERTPVKGGSV